MPNQTGAYPNFWAPISKCGKNNGKRSQSQSIFPNSTPPDNGVFVDLDIYREGEDFYKDDFRRARIKSFMEDKFDEAETIVEGFQKVLNVS